jgi:hypothetical protein
MTELTLQNIDLIIRDVKMEEIIFSHLLEDLIDHVCCDVEDEMQNGLNFTEAYKKVKDKMGTRRLKEIQEETLYSVDTKYRYMKNTMKISGIAGSVMLGFAAMLKIQHFPGAGILMTLGALILAFVFLPTSLGVLWKETHSKKRIFLFIAAFLAGIFFISGTLFKVQHWPGAGIMLSLAALSGILFFIPALFISRIMEQENKTKRPVYLLGAAGIICYSAGMLFKIQHWPLAVPLMNSGVILLFFVAFPWYTWVTWKEESHISPRFLFLVIGSLAIAVPGVLINLNLQNSFNYGYYSNQEQQQLLYKYKTIHNQVLINQYRDSSCYKLMEQVHSNTTGLLTLIGNIETKMVAESEGKPGMTTSGPVRTIQSETGPEIQYNLLSDPFQTEPVIDFLIPSCSSRQEIENAVLEYEKYLSEIISKEEFQKYEGLLNPSQFLPKEISEVPGISLMSGLHSLELYKNSILSVESYILVTVAYKHQPI